MSCARFADLGKFNKVFTERQFVAKPAFNLGSIEDQIQN